MLKVAFDVDDTLIIPSIAGNGRNNPNYDTIELFNWFKRNGNDMIIWSGSGCDWAKTWAEKLGLEARIIRKGSERVDIAVDDCNVDLGKINIKVKRIKNYLSREKWNKQKR